MRKKIVKHFSADAIKSRGLEPLKALIDDIGGWPVVDDDSDSSWVEMREKSVKLGLNIEFPLSFFVIPDYMKNSSRRMIAVCKVKAKIQGGQSFFKDLKIYSKICLFLLRKQGKASL